MLFFSFSCVLCTYVCIHSLKSREQKAHSTARVRHEPFLWREWLSLAGCCTVIMGIRLVKERRQTRGSLSGSGAWWLVAGWGMLWWCLFGLWMKQKILYRKLKMAKRKKRGGAKEIDAMTTSYAPALASIYQSVINQSIQKKQFALLDLGSLVRAYDRHVSVL